jgi:hypothetical protein
MMEQVPPKRSGKRGCLKGCAVVACITVALIAGGIWMVLDPNSPFNKPSAIACACKWARLNPLPVPSSAVHVETKGSMFSREFIVTFTGKREDILAWLNASSGTQNPYRDSASVLDMHQTISPGGGAQFAEIAIYERGTKVVIHVYWS